MIRMTLKFRTLNGAYGTVAKTGPDEKITDSAYLTWILNELPVGSTLVSIRFEALVLTPEEIILTSFKAKSSMGTELKPL